MLICVVLREVAIISPMSINAELDPRESELTISEEINACVPYKYCVVNVDIDVLRPRSVEKLDKDDT